MTDLTEHIREILERHRIDGGNSAGCRCGVEGFSDHSTHVASEIIDRLRRLREAANNESRYIGAWFNGELTLLEGAE